MKKTILVLVLFPSGTIATKQNLKKNTKADDGEWKQWVSKLVLKTKSPVLPIFFDGQNSQLYHIANKIGQTFRYSLMMYELKRKIGDTINDMQEGKNAGCGLTIGVLTGAEKKEKLLLKSLIF